jgi:LacI family transcriptional regulator
MAFNDLIAIGALRAFHACGLRVPQDISVIGYDDIEVAAYTIPSLTTIAQPSYRVGQLSLKKICDILQGHADMSGSSVHLECPLILRESTGICSE